jgi:multicomponent Na+:H+ antiporter subunit D
MRLAMGIAAVLCIFLGVYPHPLYQILPYPVEYVPYTAFHVVGMLQLLMFGALAFTLLILSGYYLPEKRAVNLDTDWFYRKGTDGFLWLINGPMAKFGNGIRRVWFDYIPDTLTRLSRNPMAVLLIVKDAVLLNLLKAVGSGHAPAVRRRLDRQREDYPNPFRYWALSSAVWWVIFLLIAYLLIFYLRNLIRG